MRIWAAALAALLIGAFAFSGAFIAVNGGHECTNAVCACPEKDCPHSRCGICDTVTACRDMLAGLGAAMSAAALTVRFALLVWRRKKTPLVYFRRTPVQLRTMLLC